MPPEELAPDVEEESAAVLARFPAGNRPCALAVADDGRVFVTANSGDAVVEFDPAERGVQSLVRVRTGSQPCGVAVVGDRLWVAELGGPRLAAYDPDTGEELASVALEAEPWDLQAGAGRLWTVERGTGRLLGVDPTTAEVAVVVDDLRTPSGIAVTDDGTVWVADEGADQVVLVDGASGRVTRRLDAPSPRWFARSPGAVWVSVVGAHSLWRLDEATGDVELEVDLGEGRVPLDIGYSQGVVWSPDHGSGVVQTIDPESGRILGEVKLQTGVWVAEAVGSTTWVTNFDFRARGHVYELDAALMPPPFASR